MEGIVLTSPLQEPRHIAEILAATIVILATLSGFAIWAIKRSVNIATKQYVDEIIDEELNPISETANEAHQLAQQNEEELRHLVDMIEGGNSKFDKGIMDYLDENIERTEEVKDEIAEIHRNINEIKRSDD